MAKPEVCADTPVTMHQKGTHLEDVPHPVNSCQRACPAAASTAVNDNRPFVFVRLFVTSLRHHAHDCHGRLVAAKHARREERRVKFCEKRNMADSGLRDAEAANAHLTCGENLQVTKLPHQRDAMIRPGQELVMKDRAWRSLAFYFKFCHDEIWFVFHVRLQHK